MRAMSQALRLAAAFLLELDPRSLTLADILEDGQNTLYLVDLTDGGSGLLARLKEKARCSDWLGLARRILTHEHRPSDACVNACPECLLTHDNRAEHRRRPFRRLEGLEALNQLLSDLVEEPLALESGSSNPGQPKPTQHPTEQGTWGWEEVQELSVLEAATLKLLMDHGVPIPEVGSDLVLGQEIVGNAELCWPDLKVALVREGEILVDMPGWTLVHAEGQDSVRRILDALGTCISR
jgi:hypothetical protein